MKPLKINKQITNSDAPALRKYLYEIGKISIISSDEEVILARKIKQDDKDALEKLVNANLRFVVTVAKKYQFQGLSLSDLINEGNIGLITAAHRFDETRGFKFISYAVFWIRQSILKALSEKSRIVRYPQSKTGIYNKVNLAALKLEQILRREPSNAEISQELNISEINIKEVLKMRSSSLSIDSQQEHDCKGSWIEKYHRDDHIDLENKLNDKLMKNEITKALSFLNSREAQVIKLYYGLDNVTPCSLDTIGNDLDLTRERVRQIKNSALKKLRNKNICSVLLEYIST